GQGSQLQVLGRLKDGTDEEQAQLELATIASRLAEAYPETNEGIGANIRTISENDTGPELIAILTAMQIATIFVLLIACANVANLLLSRAALRTKEAAVRTALGGSKLRVMAPFFAEALVLATIGATIGLAIAKLGISLFDSATQDVGKPYYMKFAMDLPILFYVIGITAFTALVAGIAPAWQIGRVDINGVLKDEARGSSSFHGGKISRVLVIGEIALSCALLVGAGLMTKSIVSFRNYDFPFETEQIFTARLGLFEAAYPEADDRLQFFDRLETRLKSIPNAELTALSSNLPGNGMGSFTIAIEGNTYETEQEYPRARSASITDGYFETLGVQILQGRNFQFTDNADAPKVAIVNQKFAKTHFPDTDPVGRRFREGTEETAENWVTIVGVVPDLLMGGIGNDDTDPAGYYVPLKQRDTRFVSIFAKPRGGNPMDLAADVRTSVLALDGELPLYWVQTLKASVDENGWFYTVFGTLFIVFGIAALFMASVGLYAVLAFNVSRRIHEMGIRMALGAAAQDVVNLVLKQGMIQMAVGLVIGMAMAFGLSSVMTILMFEMNTRDPMVFIGIVLLIAVVGALASFIPARRATKVDPMVALRYE
ncbi:MAG: ABC transporter permease, partial [Gemmatimonadota bacterium]|nr:ABC transporter permease [Gemmatimonadota bacterium]